MMSNNNSKSGVTGITILQIAFIVLKLCGVIKWGWIFVLMPTWIEIILIIIITIFYFV